jgi:hypothetical protein
MRTVTDVTGPMIGVGGIIWAVGMLAGLAEVVLWLRLGAWVRHDLVWAIGNAPITSWDGVDQILSWCWMQPLWSVVAFAGMTVALLGLAIEYNNR